MKDDSSLQEKDSNPTPESIRMYYQHQYERMAQLENQRQTFTTIILTLSILAFTFGFEVNNSGRTGSSSAILQNIILLVVIAIANVMAVSYMHRTKSWISSHRFRAKEVLRKYDVALFDLDKDSLDKSWDSYQRKEVLVYQQMYRMFGGRGRTQEKLHWILLIGCLAMLIVQIVELI